MILKSVELRQVRRIKSVKLDLSNPLTVIGGPQGVGKTTVQRAILASLFLLSKKERDALQSRFDLDSSPGSTLVCTKQAGGAEIVLKRDLLDDSGEWREDGVVIKAKGKALERMQEVLPISPDAAALLLWGLQEEMAAVLEAFPADGHSLLAHAVIRGGGPDPKQVIADLEKESKAARSRGAVNPGVLTRCEQRVEGLRKELGDARTAAAKVTDLQSGFGPAKKKLATAKQHCEEIAKRIEQFEKLEIPLDATLQAARGVTELEAKIQEWDGLDDKIAKRKKNLADRQSELNTLEAHYRVARDDDLTRRIAEREDQIKAIEEAQRQRAALEEKAREKARPGKSEEDEKNRIEKDIEKHLASMAATGVSYELSVQSGSKLVQIAEDGSAPKSVRLKAGEEHQGVVGRVVIVADELRIAAGGKQDLSGLKRLVDTARGERDKLFGRFGAADAAQFNRLRDERAAVETALAEAKQVEKELQASRLAAFRSELQGLRRDKTANAVKAADRERAGSRVLESPADIKNGLSKRQGAIDAVREELANLENQRPTDAESLALRKELDAQRKLAAKHRADFAQADQQQREPSAALLHQVQDDLKSARAMQPGFIKAWSEASDAVTNLAAELKHASPQRDIPAVAGDLQEAETALRHEELMQQARELLVQTIENKISALTANIPRELGQSVTKHLQRLTRGALEGLSMTEGLQVSAVAEKGSTLQWKPAELSCGERHQAALALKIAVACAIAESSGPVFVILDDSLVSFDPQRRAAAEKLLLDLVADGKLQVILLTCHTDWAEDWRRRTPERIHYIELGRVAEYYRPPPSLSAE